MAQAPFKTTGFMAPGQAYRLLGLGITPPTPLGYGRLSPVSYSLTGLAPLVTDSGPSQQNLIVANNISLITSPLAQSFVSAAQSNGASYMQTPLGNTDAQGAVSGTAFTIEFVYSVANTSVPPLIGRYGDPQYQITASTGSGWIARWWDSGGTQHQINGGTLTTAMTYIALSWSSTAGVSFFVNGVLVASSALSSVKAPSAKAGLMISGNTGDVIDELRCSLISRYSASYAVATAPFGSDLNTGCLYHF